MDIIYYYWISFRSSEAHLGTFSAASQIRIQGEYGSSDKKRYGNCNVIKKILQSDEGGDIRPGKNVLDATGEVRIKGEKNGQVIVFIGSFLFKEGSAELRIGALPVLDGIAKVMLDGDEKISVEGHTDDREKPVNSRYIDRWDLSAARAVNVLKYLIEKGKVPEQRLSAVGYGGSRRVKPNMMDKDRLGNHRVEIVIANDAASN